MQYLSVNAELMMVVMLVLSLVSGAWAMTAEPVEKVFHVRDFGALPNDDKDDAPGIRRAVEAAIQSGPGATVKLDAGVYRLAVPQNAEFIKVHRAHEFTLRGEVDQQGQPVTRLQRIVPLENKADPPMLLLMQESQGVKLADLIIDNSPHHCTLAQVLAVSDSSVIAQVLDGLPHFDGMNSYCVNVWDLATRQLRIEPSLTFGPTADHLAWRRVEGDKPGVYRLDGVNWSAHVRVGDGLSWHFGWKGRQQVQFYQCTDVVLENLRVANAISMSIIISQCHNVDVRAVHHRSDGRQLAVGPRDGLHIAKCTGRIVVRDSIFEGLRWDAININSPYARVEEVRTPAQVLISRLPTLLAQPLWPSDVVFYPRGQHEPIRRQQTAAKYVGKDAGGRPQYLLDLDTPLPAQVKAGDGVSIEGWLPEVFEVTDCRFADIAGGAIVLQVPRTRISNTRFERITYNALHLGGTHEEGIVPFDVRVDQCHFETSGWVGKGAPPTAVGAIAVENHHVAVPKDIVKDLQVIGCTFEAGGVNDSLGLYLHGAENVTIAGNRFNVATPWRIVGTTVTGLTQTNNTFTQPVQTTPSPSLAP